MSMSFSATGVDYDSDYVYYHVTCNIENIGSGLAKNPKVNIAAMALEKGEDYIWIPDHTIELDDYFDVITSYSIHYTKLYECLAYTAYTMSHRLCKIKRCNNPNIAMSEFD